MRADHKQLVLALYPCPRGLAFAVFEGPLSPRDWGTKDIRGGEKNARTLLAAQQLIDRLQPDIVTMRDAEDPQNRRSPRVRRLQHLIAHYAQARAIDVQNFSRKDIQCHFAAVGAKTRYEIAQFIAGQIHAFGTLLPPPRKAWMSEDVRMHLFDAIALAITSITAGDASQ